MFEETLGTNPEVIPAGSARPDEPASHPERRERQLPPPFFSTEPESPNAPPGRLASSPGGPDDESSLVPARMLKEFTYCPRLGYLEWVQGEWAENLETAQGTFGHRNCDKPDRQNIPARPEAPAKAGKQASDDTAQVDTPAVSLDEGDIVVPQTGVFRW